MNTSFSGAFCAGLFSLGLAVSADAALLSRLGGQAVYDTDLNITWLADTSAALGSGFDDGFGRMNWSTANAWAASITVGGFNNWRLPTADMSCGIANCATSEMGHLFYRELGGTSGNSIFTSSDPDLSLFSFFRPGGGLGSFWTSSSANISGAFDYHFDTGTGNDGFQSIDNKNILIYAWAVRDGDVLPTTSVPTPSLLPLIGIGLMGMIGLKRRRKYCPRATHNAYQSI